MSSVVLVCSFKQNVPPLLPPTYSTFPTFHLLTLPFHLPLYLPVFPIYHAPSVLFVLPPFPTGFTHRLHKRRASSLPVPIYYCSCFFPMSSLTTSCLPFYLSPYVSSSLPPLVLSVSSPSLYNSYRVVLIVASFQYSCRR